MFFCPIKFLIVSLFNFNSKPLEGKYPFVYSILKGSIFCHSKINYFQYKKIHCIFFFIIFVAWKELFILNSWSYEITWRHHVAGFLERGRNNEIRNTRMWFGTLLFVPWFHNKGICVPKIFQHLRRTISTILFSRFL